MTHENLIVTAARGRILALNAIYSAQSGHPGGSMSCMDILVALYYSRMNVNAEEPNYHDRDRLVLSKGHCTPALYAVLAMKGFFPVEDLRKFRQIDSYLQGHPDLNKVPGVDMSTGSLGQGLSAGNGIALAGKLDKKDYRVYVILGDGECQEGQVWEAAMAASHYKLDNLTAILDLNGLQSDGKVEKVMSLGNIKEKFRSFGWETSAIDGHDFEEILNAFEFAHSIKGKPTIIIAKTIKGKGVSFMENDPSWHSKGLTDKEYKQALEELTLQIEQCGGESYD